MPPPTAKSPPAWFTIVCFTLSSSFPSGGFYEADPWQTCRSKKSFERSRCHRCRCYGSTRLSAKVVGEGKGRGYQRCHDGGVQDSRHRSADAPCQCYSARPRMGATGPKRRAKNAGLLLAYEKTGYDKTGPGRLGDLLDHWSARRLKEAGADCVKILLYYTPFDPKEVNDTKHAWVERIGDECRANDIPYFLEFVGYQEGADEKGLEYAKRKPEIVTESMREFSKDRYGVDVLKVEVPVNMKFVEGTKSFGGQKAYTKKEAIDLFHKAANVATKPFIYLSAGVSNAEFSETLELAGESGVKFNGVLCGRATWKDGIPIYAKQGAAAFRKWLETDGVKNIDNVNGKLKAATSWHSIYGVEPALTHA